MAVDQTKVRLLEAAGREFAEKGFEGATVRSISDRAGTNLASVNYHFRDKEGLYVEAVLHAHRCAGGLPGEIPPDVEPGEALRQFIHHFLGNVVALRGETWHHSLMLRELLAPTRASEALVQEAIRPQFERLEGILRRLCPEADDRRIDALAFSVVGQCLHYKFSRPISERLVGPEAFGRLDLEYLSDHITRFTLAGLEMAPCFGGGAGAADPMTSERGGRR